MNELKCDFCEKEFDNISGRLLDGKRYCWRCQLKDISKEKLRQIIEAEKNRIENRWQILDL